MLEFQFFVNCQSLFHVNIFDHSDIYIDGKIYNCDKEGKMI